MPEVPSKLLRHRSHERQNSRRPDHTDPLTGFSRRHHPEHYQEQGQNSPDVDSRG